MQICLATPLEQWPFSLSLPFSDARDNRKRGKKVWIAHELLDEERPPKLARNKKQSEEAKKRNMKLFYEASKFMTLKSETFPLKISISRRESITKGEKEATTPSKLPSHIILLPTTSSIVIKFSDLSCHIVRWEWREIDIDMSRVWEGKTFGSELN